MILTVASGKGGTGKTMVSTSLALALGRTSALTFLDCDVEEPNARFFLKPDPSSPEEEVTVLVPDIQLDRCTFCGRCAEICVYNALAVLPDDVLVFEDLCHSCGGCLRLCPEQAVREKPKRIGGLHHGRSGAITFVEGRLDVGQVLAPPLIRAVKGRIPVKGLAIIDAPPGTSCPLIETVRGSDYALLVTEPTPFGLHDLELAVKTLRMFDIPSGVVLNRAGTGDRGVEEFCREESIPILLTIPLDREIAEAYARGRPLIEAKPEYAQALLDVYHDIRAELSALDRNSHPGGLEP